MRFAYLVVLFLARPCVQDNDLDNEGTEFILCYMDNLWQDHDQLLEMYLYITTSSETQVNVNVTAPLYDPTFAAAVSVTRGEAQKVQLPDGIRGSGTNAENKGIGISASDDVTVYAINARTYSTDAFVAFPVDTLGTDYIIVTWSSDGTFMLVSTEDGTRVRIHVSQAYRENDLTFNGITYQAGDILNITLDKWQTFHAYTRGDFTGTRIQSSHVITVMSGSQRTSVLDPDEVQVGSKDHLVEQLLPVQSWGREFITISTPDRNISDLLKIVAAEDSTRITLGQSRSEIMNAGQFLLFKLDSNRYLTVTADRGVMPALFSTSTRDPVIDKGDPSMSLLVPIQLYQSKYTFSTVDKVGGGSFNNYLVIAIKNADKDGVMLDQQSISGTAVWSDVEGTSDYVVTTLKISRGEHSVENTNTKARFLGMVFGNTNYNSYAYASGLRLDIINSLTTTSTTCTTNTATSALSTTTASTIGPTSTAFVERICGRKEDLVPAKTIDNFCSILNMSGSTSQLQLEQKMEETKTSSLIDKSKTSKARRRHTSAADDRLSAKIIGYAAGGILITFFVGMVLLVDIVPFVSAIVSKTTPETMTQAQQINNIYENELAMSNTSEVGRPVARDIFITEC